MYRIFIVEDDEVIARVLGEHLRQWGYTTQCVQDFEHVLAEAEAFAPQLMLWIFPCLFSTASTGAPNCAGAPACPSFSFPLPRIK